MPCGRKACDADDDNKMPSFDWHRHYEEKYKQELNFLTYIACEYFTKLEAQGIKIPEYAITWWEQHKIADLERIAEEKRKEKELKQKQLEQALKNKEEAEKVIKKLTSNE